MPNDGSPRPLLLSGASHTTGSQPDVQLLLDKLRRARNFLDAAVELTGLGAWELDIRSGKVRWSKNMYAIFGLDPATFQPTYEGVMEEIHPDDRESVSRHLQTVLTKHNPVMFEYRALTPARTVAPVRSYAAVDCDEQGEPYRLWGVSLGVGEDASSQK